MLTSTRNPAVARARRLARGGADGEALVEAPGAIAAAVEAGALRVLWHTHDAAQRHPDLLAAAHQAGATVQPVADHVLEAMAATRGPQGMVGVAVLAPVDPATALDEATLAVVCVAASDPGNVGTVVRTADAAGADAVLLADHAVDPANPKAIRAAAGSLFHLPVGRGAWEEVAEAARQQGLALVACDHTAATAHHAADLRRPTALVLGSEAHGLSRAVVAACDHVVAVPQRGRAESLSLPVAAGVVLFEAARQRGLATPPDPLPH